MKTRGFAVPAALLIGTLSAGPAPAPRGPARLLTREQMESKLPAPAEWRFVYGTRDAASSAVLRGRALLVARRLFDADSTQVMADSAVGAATLARGPVLLLGSPRENRWTARWADRWPVKFTARGFHWFGTDYEEPGDVIHLVYPHPLAPQCFLLLLAGNSPAALTRRGGGFYFGGEDYRIFRDGELARAGSFAQDPRSPWRYDPALDHDREAERRAFARSVVESRSRAVAVLAAEPLHRDGTVARVRARAEELAARWGWPAAPVRLTLYAGLEQKGELTHDTREEHLDAESGRAHVALSAGRRVPDLWSWCAAGAPGRVASPSSAYAAPAGMWMAGAYDGEPLAVAVARLWFGRVWPDAAQAAARASPWRSPRLLTPARAVLCGALLRVGGVGALGRATRSDAGTLDSLAQSARVSRAALAAAYRTLADSLARAGMARERASGASRPAGAPARFERGVCLAHALDMRRGYLSAECAAVLQDLRSIDVDAVSLSPFGYMPSLATPEIYPGAEGGPDEESDEAVAEAAARAHALGMRVQLKPHLWSRGWIGEIDPGTPAGWREFFARYREFVLHYALLAQRHGIESFCVGHEMKSTTAAHEEEWRALIVAVRNVYRGALTYGANWDEVEAVPFWDMLDEVGVSFYYPLAEKPTRDGPALRAGAERALAGLELLGRRVRKPVVLVEAGYAAQRGAPVRPWEEGPGPADPETQRACYQALIQALEGRRWVGGVYWWKWFSFGAAGGMRDASFSPQRKPARDLIEKAFARWKGRGVRVG